MIDNEKFYNKLTQVYKYRGLNDLRVTKDENTTGLLVNYPEKFIELAVYYLSQGDTARTLELLNSSKRIYPDYWRTYVVQAQVYRDRKDSAAYEKVLVEGENNLKKSVKSNPDNHTYHQYSGLFYQMQGKAEEAIPHLVKSYKMSPSNLISYRSLLSIYVSRNRTQEAITLVESWLKGNPSDQFSYNLLQQLRTPRPNPLPTQ